MCGISAIFNKSGLPLYELRKANEIVSYRGPDDEGYMTWSPGATVQVLAGRDTAPSTMKAFQYSRLNDDHVDWKVGFGHRRLSILDISPAGHQPMTLQPQGLVISFNGEIFNYIEIRQELEKLGHHFKTGSDTEVILHAWAEWGPMALHHFNGMFSFVLLDTNRGKLYAVRDRFGVKPLYYVNTSDYMAFASEIKQLTVLPGYSFKLNKQIAYDYLSQSLLDHDTLTFEEGILQLNPGYFIELDIHTGIWNVNPWYQLVPKRWEGSEAEACEHFYELLKDSVRLRMRSDVPVGSALSGGLDSSTVVSLMREVVTEEGKSGHDIKTITSCNQNKKYDEWEYAKEVIQFTRSKPFQVFPTFEKLVDDLDKMIWHMDYPFGSTSQFSQWCVFEEAKKQGLTVMIDGQGADEQLAGYGRNDMALYTGLIKHGRVLQWIAEAKSYRDRKGSWPRGFLIGSIQMAFPFMQKVFPGRLQPSFHIPNWIKSDGFQNRVDRFTNLRAHLINQVKVLPLPSLLRYEDRNSMAFSVESRVPFMDYRLMEFTLGLDETMVYRKGERKYILRKALQGHVPEKILARRDKMGFVSAEEEWLKNDGKEWFTNQLEDACVLLNNFAFPDRIRSLGCDMQQSKVPFNFDLWRIICFSRWYNMKAGI